MEGLKTYMYKLVGCLKALNVKYRFSFIIFIFFLIFSPPIIPQINTAIIATMVAAGLLVTKYRTDVIKAFEKMKMNKFIIVMGIFFAYVAVVAFVNIFIVGEKIQLMHYIKLGYRFFLIIPILLICVLYICIRSKELNYSIYNLAMCFVIATMIQFLLVLVALLFPSIKELFVSIIYANTGDAYLDIPWVMERRGFGFCNSFVDSFGFGMGIIACLPLFFVKKHNWKVIYFVPCLIFVSLVNVRTGIVMAGMGLVVSIPIIVSEFIRAERFYKIKAIKTIAISIGVLLLLLALVALCNRNTLKWIMGDFSSVIEATVPGTEEIVINIETDSQTTTADTLFSDRFWNIPPITTFIFGSGHTIYGAEGYPNSDVGYINDLWLGGVIGCALLYGAFAGLFARAYKSAEDKNIKLLVVYLALAILVFQIKANAIMFNAGLNTIIPILFYICYYRGEKNDFQ